VPPSPDRSGRATGRLDLLGGVADYSGALVLEVPTRCATTVTLHPADRFEVGSAALSPAALTEIAALSYPEIREALSPFPKWTRYPLGVAVALMRHGAIEAPTGRVSIDSSVPQSAGVSSSAALEVATARALGVDIDPLTLAAICQEAENQIVGAPCGIMDQVTVSLGAPGEVLPILCRPASVDSRVTLPADYEVIGWPTGATHDVAGSEYGTARAAAFMGKQMVEEAHGAKFEWVSEIPADAVTDLPETIDGASYLDRWAITSDPLSVVEPSAVYPIRAATGFGVGEHRRTTAALVALRAGELDALGDLMAASHAGYTAMGLGHPAADAVVAEAVSRPEVVGARASGGGCGGTVAVLCRTGSLASVAGVIR